jgi:putative oxidoreductase
MESIKKFLNQPDLGLLLFRVFIGAAMAFAHGLGKLPPSEQLVQGVTAMGFPQPELFAWAASLSEFAGGLLIVIGLLTRPAALFLGVTMFVAAFVAHANDTFQQKEMALLYLFSCVLLLFCGPGKFSADRLIRRV